MRGFALLLLLAGSLAMSAQEAVASCDLTDNNGILTAQFDSGGTLQFLTDNNESTICTFNNTNNVWIQYQSPVPVFVSAYSIVSSTDTTLYDPKSCKLKASNDGSTWITISSDVGKVFSGRNQSSVSVTNLTDPSTQSYTFFRLEIKIYNATTIKIADWQLFGVPKVFDAGVTNNGGTLTGEYPGLSSFNEVLTKVTDHQLSKYTQTGTSSIWFQYESPVPVQLKRYALTTPSGNADRNPSSWVLYGSSDATDWSVLDSRHNKNFFDASYNQQVYDLTKTNDYLWGDYAEEAQQGLYRQFWNGSYFNQHNTPVNTGFNYWWHAHILDVLVDGYVRFEESRTAANVDAVNPYKVKLDDVYRGVLAKGNGSMWNTFYDDMEWMGLASLRAYYATNNIRWKTLSIQLFGWIKGGWTTVNNGGVMWASGSPDSKNACSNAPAMILAARLYTLTGDQTCLDFAIKVYDWMDMYLVDHTRGLVWDSYENYNEGMILTYNQGTWMGGCLELYLTTHDIKYKNRALQTAEYLVGDRVKFSPYGVLKGENTGDGGLFKGIFMRYLSQMIEKGDLDEETNSRFVNYFKDNSVSLWYAATLKPQIVFGNNWTSRPTEIGSDCSVYLSALMQLELTDELKRNNVFENDKLVRQRNVSTAFQYFKLQIENNNGSPDTQLTEWQLFDINYQEPVSGISRIVNNDLFVYAAGNTIRLTDTKYNRKEYSIFDSRGMAVASGSYSGNLYNFKVSAPGLYLIHVKTQEGVSVFKVLISGIK